MSSLESTIEEVIKEGVSDDKKEIQHEVPGKGDAAPAAKSKTDPDAEKHATDAAAKAGDATKEAPKTNKAAAGEKGEEPKDGVNKVDKTSIPNQEEVEDDSDAPQLDEMSKSELLKQAVASMKEMDLKALRTAHAGLSEEDDEDGSDDEKSESLSRNALIRGVVEALKDKSVKEVQDFIKAMSEEDEVQEDASDDDRDEDKGEGKKIQKKTTPVESKTEVSEAEMEDDDEEEEDEEEEEEEEVKKESLEVDMTDDINALVADEDLSEDFKVKAKTIFEAAVSAKSKEVVAEKEAQLKEEYDQKVEETKNDLTEKVDSYLNYVAESWVSENELAIERGLKSELTEDFINGLKKLFEEHYVEVPEDKFDVVEELASRLDEQEDKLNDEVANNIKLQQDIEELQREKIISEASDDLADSEKEKLKELTEDVDFENEENFVEKVSTLKEAYFKGEKLEAVSDDGSVVSSDANFDSQEETPVDPGMARYTAAISKSQTVDVK